MTVALLVPRRPHADRDRLWAWAKARWQRYFPDVPVFEGEHLASEGPFNRAAAVNRAARAAGAWELGIVIDADVFLKVSQVQEAIWRASQTGRVTWAHRRWRGLSEDWTRRTVADGRDFGAEVDATDMDVLIERTNPISWSCCFVVPRAVWDDTGGMDERFVGWGFEDMAWQSLIVGLYGHERVEGDVYHLWHPRSDERITQGEPATTASPHYVLNARLGRRYMVAARRDYGLHDRPETADADEMQRDIANLKRDDARLTPIAKRHGLPEWSDWWPSLEELRDGAKLHRLGPDPTVTVIIRTGGEPETWADRVEYLRQSLVSFATKVTGPIVQRVIYSDWGAEHRDELAAIAEQHGFYVAGDGHRGYQGSVARLWRYIDKRARGEFVFLAEDDFTYRRQVDLEPMAQTLREQPHLRQIALLRAAYYPREHEAGGVIGSLKTPVELMNHRPHPYLQHRDHWTMNPSLVRKSVTRTPWPQRASSERHFGDALLRDPDAAFAYWGAGEPWIDHIGDRRAASVY